MDSKELAREIFADALEASLPKNFISKYCQLKENILSIGSEKYDLNAYRKIYLCD